MNGHIAYMSGKVSAGLRAKNRRVWLKRLKSQEPEACIAEPRIFAEYLGSTHVPFHMRVHMAGSRSFKKAVEEALRPSSMDDRS